jgi:hypothetical protein
MRKKWRQRLRELRAGRDAREEPVGDPRHWRERAEAARAKFLCHETSRSTNRLGLLAETYERVADRMERRLEQGAPAPKRSHELPSLLGGRPAETGTKSPTPK